MLTISEYFIRQLKLTQYYCEEQLKNTDKNYASILRSINPIINNKRIFAITYSKFEYPETEKFYEFGVDWTTDPFDNYPELFEKLYKIQNQKKNETTNYSLDKKFQGDILAFKINDTLNDGAAAIQSHGFYDDYNCPPIDTWFSMTNHGNDYLLLSWIPDGFIKQVQDGIDVNPELCISWMKDWYPDQYEKLKAIA